MARRERAEERPLYVVPLRHPIMSFGSKLTELRFMRRARVGDVVKCGKDSTELEQVLRIVAGTAGITYAEACTIDLVDMPAVTEAASSVSGGSDVPPEDGEG